MEEECPDYRPWSQYFIVDGCLHYGNFTGKCWCERNPHYDRPCPSKGKREQP